MHTLFRSVPRATAGRTALHAADLDCRVACQTSTANISRWLPPRTVLLAARGHAIDVEHRPLGQIAAVALELRRRLPQRAASRRSSAALSRGVQQHSSPISGQRTTAETTHSIKTCSSGTVARRRFFSLPAAAGTDPVEHVRIQQTEYTRSGCVRGSPEFAPRGRSHQRVPRLQLGHRLVLFRRLIEPVPPVCEPTSHSRLAAQLGIYATAYSASHRPPPQQHMQSVDTSRHSYRPLPLCLRSQMMLHSVRPSSGSAPWHYAAGRGIRG